MLDYKEKAKDFPSPSTAGFSYDGGKAVVPLYLEEPAVEDIYTAIEELLGTTSLETGDGKLNRTLPIAHPLYTWLFVSNISNIQGLGQYTKESASEELEAPSLPFFAFYDWYEFMVEFAPRAYRITSDANIPMLNGSWYDDTGNQQQFEYFPEWLRYTDWEYVPAFEALKAQGGQYVFKGSSCASGRSYIAMPRMYLPNMILKFRWYQVPYRYIYSANSYLDRWIGRINQNDWYEWEAGELLYLGFNAKRYTPPIPNKDAIFPGAISAEKLCDIELSFLRTKRTASDLLTAPSNQNFIQKGHNLLPWLVDRKFHYAQTNPEIDPSQVCTTPSPTPSFFSFPLEVMFTDPDSTAGFTP